MRYLVGKHEFPSPVPPDLLLDDTVRALVDERASETSVDNYFTRQYIPEDKSELNTRRRENLKSHKAKAVPWRSLGGEEV
jgi:hypothetical protein